MAVLSICTLNQVPFCPQTLFMCYPKEATIVSTNTIDHSHGDAFFPPFCENSF